MQIDKLKHFSVGAVTAVVTTFFFYHGMHWLDWWDGSIYSKLTVAVSQMAMVSAAATYKELKDNYFDWWDWVATMIPSLLMFLIILIYF